MENDVDEGIDQETLAAFTNAEAQIEVVIYG